MSAHRMIGIIGGAGPMAGALLHRQIIAIAQHQYNCKEDHDFPPILHYSHPFTDVLHEHNVDLPNSSKVHRELEFCFNILKNAGVQVAGMACNTLHLYLSPEMTNGLTFVNIIDVTKSKFLMDKKQKILTFCTSTSRINRLHSPLGNVIYPSHNDQDRVDEIIDNIVAGNILESDAEFIRKCIKSSESADAALVGCTELSELNDQYPLQRDSTIPVVDPLTLLATKICELSFENQRAFTHNL